MIYFVQYEIIILYTTFYWVYGRSVHVANPARYKTKSSQSLVKTQSDSSQDQVEYLPILPTTSNHKPYDVRSIGEH